MLWTTLTHLSNELTRSLTSPPVRRRFKQADRAAGAASDERGQWLAGCGSAPSEAGARVRSHVVRMGWRHAGYETAWERRETTHYVYEPGSFTPLAQAKGATILDEGAAEVAQLAAIAYYHCDQIGTPQGVTDSSGEIAWSARYRAWGEAKEAISDAACKAGIANPLRFAGQYFDAETGLHYNRHRYYDPGTGRFVSKNPIGLDGGINIYQYAPNPISWIDPFGLSAASDLPRMKGRSVPRVGSVLNDAGFAQTKDNGVNETWKHADGSEVRVHKYGNKCPCPYRSDLPPSIGPMGF
ncbi:RHS domain-containing protein [Burkholderia multivorans]|nr:RHS domain-containing protein [Burkholderia multivorans]